MTEIREEKYDKIFNYFLVHADQFFYFLPTLGFGSFIYPVLWYPFLSGAFWGIVGAIYHLVRTNAARKRFYQIVMLPLWGAAVFFLELFHHESAASILEGIGIIRFIVDENNLIIVALYFLWFGTSFYGFHLVVFHIYKLWVQKKALPHQA